MNIIKQITLVLFLLISGFISAQNDNDFREAFTLKLAVDSTTFYQQEVARSKYIVKDDILQIYPGEHIFIEAEVKSDRIESMKVVKENKNPSKTIEIEFSQNVSGRQNRGMMLHVSNPFDKILHYNAMMNVVGKKGWFKTSIIPIDPKLTNFETWPQVIITLVLSNWRFEK
ncbi:hypothetical protein SAMN05421664_0616 [Chryseobacterium soldanellicola]|uniref:Uncharacterized protein n=1 Tax=Chryseobacterium soldanellicola TaxID=311333 RepID=A0A1H0YBG7_9FLAO|nr:hypothetical protein [Chryseobacterium soldanellicola]SDQ12430.1 hypothetical protein SAMN05421664_0616 [Chryseobacterium soldanellicola]